MPPRGFEPRSQPPQGYILSIELRGHENMLFGLFLYLSKHKV